MPNLKAQFEIVNKYFDNLRYNATHLLIVSCHVLMTNTSTTLSTSDK
ncbi:hypothetical protein GXM_01142 [Nostoc sphaeroides CCNUC1]|uniref:Uncharacterized protein n=1 Tax=Nostoc sphaeroides CCNUC1 TaxID=2653204 RepID=A0A5P8VUQ7_9NOSO|nr:hypothetical protein GXM_01142 [Nostoc sphaeroides CCNUC1]